MLYIFDIINQWDESIGVKVFYEDTGNPYDFEIITANYNVLVACPFGKNILVSDEMYEKIKEQTEEIGKEICELVTNWELTQYDVFNLIYLRISTDCSVEECIYQYEKFFAEQDKIEQDEYDHIDDLYDEGQKCQICVS